MQNSNNRDMEMYEDLSGLNYYGGTIPGNVMPMSSMPFGYNLAINNQSENGQNLTETQKEHLILKCKDAQSKEEVDKILGSLAPDASKQLLEEMSTLYGPLENTEAY